jgi:hypothetical protein
MEESGEPAEKATLVPAVRTGHHLLDAAGYLYVRSKLLANKDKCYWTCKDKLQEACTSTAVTQISTSIILSKGPHNHGNKMLENKAKEVERAKVEMAAAMPTVKPRTVLGK